MAKKRRISKKRLSLYKIDANSAISAFLKIDPKCLKKTAKKNPSPKMGLQSK